MAKRRRLIERAQGAFGEFVSRQAVRLDELGRELGGRPKMAPPIGYKKQPSMVEHIRNMVRSEQLARYALEQGMETFEEAEDFDVDDDYDPRSPWENEHDPDVRELLEAGRDAIARKQREQAARSDGPVVEKEPPEAAPPQPVAKKPS